MDIETLLQNFLKNIENATSKEEVKQEINNLVIQLENQKENDYQTYQSLLSQQNQKIEFVGYTKNQKRWIKKRNLFVIIAFLSFFFSNPIFLASLICFLISTLSIPIVGFIDKRKMKNSSPFKEEKINLLRNACMYKEKVELLENIVHYLKDISLSGETKKEGNELLEILKQEKERLNSIYVEQEPNVKYFKKRLYS